MLNFRKDHGLGSISSAFSGPVPERPSRAVGRTKWPTRGCLVHLRFLSMKEQSVPLKLTTTALWGRSEIASVRRFE